jgi:SAM-dependent methyltransferase
MASSERFGFAWSRFPKIVPEHEFFFRSWVAGLVPEDFRGKRILDAGCGIGRNSFWPLQYGAAETVAFDLDPRTVRVARENLSFTDRAKVSQSSIYEIAYQDEFDIVLSIGVIHHLHDPKRAMANLVRAAKPGGTVRIWVYAREGHTGLKLIINSVRRFTSKLPAQLVEVLTVPFSSLFYAYVHLKKHDHPYLRLLRDARFWHVHSILFDQLLPEVSNYWTREEAFALFNDLPVTDVNVQFCNEGSWAVWARKKT